MFSASSLARAATALCVALCADAVSASAVEEAAEWHKRIKKAEVPGPLGADLFGDSINYYNGQLSFAVTDIDLPGNSALPVRVGRTRSASEKKYFTGVGQNGGGDGLFGDWDLDVPYMEGTYAQGSPWHVEGANPTARCSSASNVPPTIGLFPGSSYWRGNSLYIPGVGNMGVLNSTTMPSAGDGVPTRFFTSKFWQIRCKWNASDPTNVPITSGGTGEGFVALAPDGTKYRFDRMVTRQVESVVVSYACPPNPQPCYRQLARDEVRIYPTYVEDRFGNSVTYTWSDSSIRIGIPPFLRTHS